MLSHEEMIAFQAEKHDLVKDDAFANAQEYVLHLIHTAAYTHAARVAAGKSVLDVGCNSGYGTHILSLRAQTTVGVDVSERAIAHARARYAGDDLRFEAVDGAGLPFPDGSFDVVTSFQVIEHLVDHAPFLDEVKRVLAPGGVVLLTTPNALLRLDPGMKPWYEFHVREYNPQELACLLDGHFSHVRVLGMHGNEPLHTIEVDRLDRARRAARAEQPAASSRSVHTRLRAPVRALRPRVKRILPERVLRRLRAIETPEKRRLFREIVQNHGVGDFRYQSGDVEQALDLLAVCSDAPPEPHVESISAT